MYENILNVIKNDDYKLGEMLEKIDTMYIKGRITKEQMEELEELARQNANVGNSVEIIEKLKELELRIKELENKEETEPTPGEEYPEYIPGKWYYKGDKISFKGKKYICIAPEGQVCVWSPEEYPTYWEEVKEEI